MKHNWKYWLGMALSAAMTASVCADQFPDGRLKHTLQLVGILSTAINGYMIQHPPDRDDYISRSER